MHWLRTSFTASHTDSQHAECVSGGECEVIRNALNTSFCTALIDVSGGGRGGWQKKKKTCKCSYVMHKDCSVV